MSNFFTSLAVTCVLFIRSLLSRTNDFFFFLEKNAEKKCGILGIPVASLTLHIAEALVEHVGDSGKPYFNDEARVRCKNRRI